MAFRVATLWDPSPLPRCRNLARSNFEVKGSHTESNFPKRDAKEHREHKLAKASKRHNVSLGSMAFRVAMFQKRDAKEPREYKLAKAKKVCLLKGVSGGYIVELGCSCNCIICNRTHFS